MTLTEPAPAPVPDLHATTSIKVFGVGNAGLNVIEPLIRAALPGMDFIAVNPDPYSLTRSSAPQKLQLDTPLLRGLGTGGDPERGRALAEEHANELKALCAGASTVFIVAGLGGGAGTGISPVLARVAKETGALVLGFVVTPFRCERDRRASLAAQGLVDLKAAADGVVCLPNESIFKLIDQNTSLIDTFRLTNELLADGILGVWRLLTHSGLIEIHFEDLRALIQDRHSESAFAVAEAMGATRSREVAEKLLAHPMLQNGQALDHADAVLISILGGPDLTMTEVNRVMEQIGAHCERAQVIMGAAIDEAFRDRLSVTLIAARRKAEALRAQRPTDRAEDLHAQLLDSASNPRPPSRFVPPPPSVPPDQIRQFLEAQRTEPSSSQTKLLRLRQGQLPLQIVSKDRFEKSEPTIHKGEDLDVPTYIRRGIALN
jgi:cell division protein FtsZ